MKICYNGYNSYTVITTFCYNRLPVTTIIFKMSGVIYMRKNERKVTKIGNSYGITLPADLLKESGISYGDHVQLEVKEGKIIIEKRQDVELPEGIDHDFMGVLNDVIKEHRVAFKGLVDK